MKSETYLLDKKIRKITKKKKKKERNKNLSRREEKIAATLFSTTL